MKTPTTIAIATLLFPVLTLAASNSIEVVLKDAKGASAGTAKISSASSKSDGVTIALNLRKVSPGKHAIHIHDKGLCEGPDFKSAGSHLNPDQKEHGLDNPKGPHAGDMPAFEASRSGTVRTEIHAAGVSMGSGPHSLMRPEGASLIVHARADDQHTSPAGASGDRILCGVISPAQK